MKLHQIMLTNTEIIFVNSKLNISLNQIAKLWKLYFQYQQLKTTSIFVPSPNLLVIANSAWAN